MSDGKRGCGCQKKACFLNLNSKSRAIFGTLEQFLVKSDGVTMKRYQDTLTGPYIVSPLLWFGTQPFFTKTALGCQKSTYFLNLNSKNMAFFGTHIPFSHRSLFYSLLLSTFSFYSLLLVPSFFFCLLFIPQSTTIFTFYGYINRCILS